MNNISKLAVIVVFAQVLMCMAGYCTCLKFDSKTIDKSVLECTSPEIEAQYNFKNVSNCDIEIVSVETSCNCLEATTDRKIYAPNESGILSAKFTIGERIGPQSKDIFVKTLPPQTKPIILAFKLNIEARCLISSKLLLWHKNAECLLQTVTFDFPNGQMPVESKVSLKSNSFSATTRASGKSQLSIIVEPKSTAAAQTANIDVSFKFSDGCKKNYIIFALVR